MGRDLFKSCTVFRSSVLELDEVHKASTGRSLVELGLFAGHVGDEVVDQGAPVAVHGGSASGFGAVKHQW